MSTGEDRTFKVHRVILMSRLRSATLMLRVKLDNSKNYVSIMI